VNWEPLHVVQADAQGKISYVDPDATNLPQAFYRFVAVEDFDKE
jgi:hypothetical protein